MKLPTSCKKIASVLYFPVSVIVVYTVEKYTHKSK